MPPNRNPHSAPGDPRTPDSGLRTPNSGARNPPALPLRERFRELNAASSRDAAVLAAQGKHASLWELLISPLLTFLRVYLWQGAWRHGTAGLISASFAAYEVFVRHAKLWELQHSVSSTPLPTEGVRGQRSVKQEKRRSGEAEPRGESFSLFPGFSGLRFLRSSALPTGFVEQRTGKQIWWLKASWEAAIQEVLQSSTRVLQTPDSRLRTPNSAISGLRTSDFGLRTSDSPTSIISGRGATQRVELGEQGALIVRHYCRGGFVRHFVRDVYWDRPPRPFAELMYTETARQRGVSTVEVVGARVEWITGGLYRGTLITREAEGYQNLWEWLLTRPTGAKRERVMAAVARAIACMHDAGIAHADLNLTNVLVRADGDAPQVLLIDFDRARVFSDPLSQRWRERNLHRLRRSLDKLDSTGQFFSPTDVELFCQAYGKS